MSYLNAYDAIPEHQVNERVALVGQWIDTDTRAFFAELRERRPIFATPAFTLVTLWTDVQEVLSDPENFSVRLYGIPMDEAVGPFMLGRDLTDLNWHEKSLMRSTLSFDDLAEVGVQVTKQVEAAIENARAAGQIDIVETLGRDVPLQICDSYFGFPGPDRPTMKRWSKAFQTQFFKNLVGNPEIREQAIQSGKETLAYIRDLIVSKRNEDGCPCDTESTVLDRLLLTSDIQGIGMSDERLAVNIAGLLIGAVETTSQAIAQATERLLNRPDMVEAARQEIDTEKFAGYVWEALRFNPINSAVFRFAERDMEIAGGTSRSTVIKQGTMVLACTQSAMFDAYSVPDPDQFIVGRPWKHYMFFGPEYHECLGRYVAQVMVVETVRCIVRHNLKLIAGDAGKIDFKGGPFPESFVLSVGAA